MTRPRIIGPGFAERFGGDDGSADPRLLAVLAACRYGAAGPHEALAALVGARLLVPITAVATDEETTPSGPRREKNSEIAVPLLVGRDGRRALPAFTGTEALARWRPEARPTPVTTADACRSALEEEAVAVVVDVAGPAPYTIAGTDLLALAEGRGVPAPHEDPRVLSEIHAVTAAEPVVARVRVTAADDADLGIELELHGPDDEAVRRVAGALAARLARRLPRGIALSVRG
ncbi:MAG: SseB family protein [Streptosporangiales bacterium]|nr:SseB family protein [Streptosporangiales bacterium]